MGAIGFYIGLPFIYLISIIPFPLFYGVSDFFFVLLYYIIGYRKKVVYQNLKNSFPEKSHEELKAIERKFYVEGDAGGDDERLVEGTGPGEYP